MRHAFAIVAVVVFSSATIRADKIDPRLATVRTALVQPVDELANDDKPVAACLAEHLKASTPIEAVGTKDEADVILRIGSTSKQATITAFLPDGTSKLWSGTTPLKSGFGLVMVKHDACGLADKLLDTLREAMRKAPDAKK
jgi:hypothetical protein